jgi:hypothetical protein
MIAPLLLVGAVLYGMAFYFKSRKDPVRSRAMAIWGKRSWRLALLVVVLLLVYLILEREGFWYEHGWYENKWYADWCSGY